MQRTYLPWLGLPALAASATAIATLGATLGATVTLLPLAQAGDLFTGQPVDKTRFAVLAKPVGRSDWALLVLEQLARLPRCWDNRADGLVDPSLNRFDYTGICSRYLDSNGYSLRIGQSDLGSSYRLRLQQQGTSLQLLALNPNEASELLVGQGRISRRDRDGFVALELEPGWELQRRLYGQQALSHVYFANATPLARLLASNAQAAGSQAGLAPGLTPSQATLQGSQGGRNIGEGPIALQVIPFKE
ncbi:MAG: DUF3747 domain-containing protein [Cyanobacteria bacterium]|nr:DUF3747 domain-containing protein [Cyanobacteriota bacterium]